MQTKCFKNVLLLIGLGFAMVLAAEAERSPNVILVLTDDQGTGDLGCHGNPWIKTPNLDSFYEDSVRLTDFHVSQVCTPTRGAIMTGRYPIPRLAINYWIAAKAAPTYEY